MTCCAVIIDNRDWVKPIIEQHEKFIPKNWPVYWIKDEQTNTAHDYNKLLTSKRFWRVMPDKVLIFQHDSFLLKNGVENFIEWDYIGAHIKWLPGYMNGGLSLRDSKAMLKVINHIPWEGQNEDLYFIDGLRQLSGYLPDEKTCHRFSVETEFHLGSIGGHAIEKYLTAEQCTQIKNQYL